MNNNQREMGFENTLNDDALTKNPLTNEKTKINPPPTPQWKLILIALILLGIIVVISFWLHNITGR